MEIRPRGLQKTDYVSVLGQSFIDWADIIMKEGLITPEECERILSDVVKHMERAEGNFTMLDVRVLLGNASSGEWTPESVTRWEKLIQRFADDVKEPYYTSFYVIA
jgi:hypothetical protein